MPDRTMPDRTMPDRTMPDRTMPDRTTPDHPSPAGSMPARTMPDPTMPALPSPSRSMPARTMPDPASSHRSMHVRTMPGPATCHHSSREQTMLVPPTVERATSQLTRRRSPASGPRTPQDRVPSCSPGLPSTTLVLPRSGYAGRVATMPDRRPRSRRLPRLCEVGPRLSVVLARPPATGVGLVGRPGERQNPRPEPSPAQDRGRELRGQPRPSQPVRMSSW